MSQLQDLVALIEDCRSVNARIRSFEASCFSGVYITGDITPEYLAGVPERRIRIAVELCRTHPGAINDLLRMVERAEWFVAENQPGHDFTEAGREAEILRIATQTAEEHVLRVAAMANAAGSGKKGKKKKK